VGARAVSWLAQLPLILGFACYSAINLYLWSLPISPQSRFLLALPLGIMFFLFFMWRALRR
jgi:hypothetical protein